MPHLHGAGSAPAQRRRGLRGLRSAAQFAFGETEVEPGVQTGMVDTNKEDGERYDLGENPATIPCEKAADQHHNERNFVEGFSNHPTMDIK